MATISGHAGSAQLVAGGLGGRAAVSPVELATTGAPDLYEAIARVRPRLLQPGLPTVDAPDGARPTVFLARLRLGDVDRLHALTITDVASVRYLSRTEAAIEFGGRYPGGVIIVEPR